jgi:dihydrolipoamide dehydrogenase
VSAGSGGKGAAREREEIAAQLVVLGAGPGGYTAAFRAADLGLKVVLVERHESLGGVCLNVGCIPSKSLLHVAKVLSDAAELDRQGILLGPPKIDLETMRRWKEGVVGKLTTGLSQLARLRGVRVLRGDGRLTGPHVLTVGDTSVRFEHAILATGSRTARLPGVPYEDERVMSSNGALALEEVPDRLLVIGGGIIGLELATVYDALGSEVTVVELAEQLIPGCDPDLVAPLARRLSARYAGVHLKTRVESIESAGKALRATFATEGDGKAPPAGEFERVLVAVGRVPRSDSLGLESAGVASDEAGFVTVDSQQRTSVPHIYAIGDLTGPPMLAHKATHEGKVAAEVIAGHDIELDVRGIPSVAYTDPEVAWVGLTESEAQRVGQAHRSVAFPWTASGRALASDATAGLTKLILEPGSNRILGAGIVGAGAGELIAEAGLALELGADALDVALTVHAHPTLSETFALAAEVAEGTVTDLPPSRR